MKKHGQFSPMGLHYLHTASKGRRKALVGNWTGLVWPQVKDVPIEIPVRFRFYRAANKIITGEMSFKSWQPGRGIVENDFVGGFKSESHLEFGYTKKEDRIIGWGHMIFVLSPDSRTLHGKVYGVSSHTGQEFYSELVLVKGMNPDLREYSKTNKPTIFIGHGRNLAWKQVQKYLQKIGYRVETFESGARGGRTIQDVLKGMITHAAFAVLVMTGEDRTRVGTMRARQNVVFEAGAFYAKLGSDRSVLLLEERVEDFSNISGIIYIPFEKNKISSTFKPLVAAIKREFPYS